MSYFALIEKKKTFNTLCSTARNNNVFHSGELIFSNWHIHVCPTVFSYNVYGFEMFSCWQVHLRCCPGLLAALSPVCLLGHQNPGALRICRSDKILQEQETPLQTFWKAKGHFSTGILRLIQRKSKGCPVQMATVKPRGSRPRQGEESHTNSRRLEGLSLRCPSDLKQTACRTRWPHSHINIQQPHQTHIKSVIHTNIHDRGRVICHGNVNAMLMIKASTNM